MVDYVMFKLQLSSDFPATYVEKIAWSSKSSEIKQ